MKAAFFFLIGAGTVIAQVQAISPVAEFDLNSTLKSHQAGKKVRSYFEATPLGLTFVTIGNNQARFASADLDGKILHSRSDLASVNAQIYSALPRSDGGFWLVASGPYNAGDLAVPTGLGDALPAIPSPGRTSAGRIDNYNELDLYNATGQRVQSARLLSRYGGLGSPLAAASNGELVLAQAQFIQFGTVMNDQFREQSTIELAPSLRRGIPVLASNGDLVFIDRNTGTMLVVDPKARRHTIVPLASPHPIRAAATDSGYIYLLSGDAVVKTNLAGEALATYQFHVDGQFQPATLAVTGHSLYLADNAGHVAQFRFN